MLLELTFDGVSEHLRRCETTRGMRNVTVNLDRFNAAVDIDRHVRKLDSNYLRNRGQRTSSCLGF